MSDKKMPLNVYPYSRDKPAIRAAPPKRDWMDKTPSAYAYRCLPLSIANAHGWEILNGRTFQAMWTGGPAVNDVKIAFDPDEKHPQDNHVRPTSHFGSATLTFELAMLFQTPPGWNMMVQGPINRPKDGISPLSGIIETDWSPYSFTMNWLFTRPGLRVTFAKGEPIAHIFPVQRGAVERFQPEIRHLSSNRALTDQTDEWRKSRNQFNADLKKREEKAVVEKWQKSYFRGKNPDGTIGSPEHQTKLRLPEFEFVPVTEDVE